MRDAGRWGAARRRQRAACRGGTSSRSRTRSGRSSERRSPRRTTCVSMGRGASSLSETFVQAARSSGYVHDLAGPSRRLHFSLVSTPSCFSINCHQLPGCQNAHVSRALGVIAPREQWSKGSGAARRSTVCALTGPVFGALELLSPHRRQRGGSLLLPGRGTRRRRGPRSQRTGRANYDRRRKQRARCAVVRCGSSPATMSTAFRRPPKSRATPLPWLGNARRRVSRQPSGKLEALMAEVIPRADQEGSCNSVRPPTGRVPRSPFACR